jgi:hypothetical protein
MALTVNASNNKITRISRVFQDDFPVAHKPDITFGGAFPDIKKRLYLLAQIGVGTALLIAENHPGNVYQLRFFALSLSSLGFSPIYACPSCPEITLLLFYCSYFIKLFQDKTSSLFHASIIYICGFYAIFATNYF